jgi:protein N-terminal amidase
MNWLDPAEQDTADSDSDDEMPSRNDPQAPSESNLNYWAARLTPFHDPTPSYDPSTGTELEPAPTKELVFVACNRVGTEVGTKFVGTSCVMTLRSNPSGIELIECCNRSEERVMVCQVT